MLYKPVVFAIAEIRPPKLRDSKNALESTLGESHQAKMTDHLLSCHLMKYLEFE